VDCELARQLLDYARPGANELDAADASALEQHLADCPLCGDRARAERSFGATIAGAMRAIPVPKDLRERLTTRLLAARRAWWRRAWLCVGSAFFALLAAGVGGWYSSRLVIDPSAVAQAAYEQSGLSRSNDEARDGVTAWLRQLDARLRAPEELNYKLFSFNIQSDFEGLTRVPTLVFVRGDTAARVYVLRENAFKNLGSLTDQPVEVGGCTVTARRYPDMNGWVFLIVISGAPLDTFLSPTRLLPPT
jgi:hypothetical protein